MAKKKELTPEELEMQADALLAAADAAEAEKAPKKSSKKSAPAEENAPVMTDEEAKKAGILRLDAKQVAALPAASWLGSNEKLRELLSLKQKRSDFSFQSARVSERSTSNWSNTLTLSRGTDAGLEVGDCVVNSTGALVGVLSAVGYNWSTVSTVIDPSLQLGGIVNRTYSAGVLEGDFSLMSQGKLKMSYLPDSAQLVSGDEVLTSGKGGVYPSGLVVGTVDGLFTDPSGISRYAVITPEANPAELIEVFVITDFDIVE